MEVANFSTSEMEVTAHQNVRAWLQLGIAWIAVIPGSVCSAEKTDSAFSDSQISRDILSERDWQGVENAVDRGLAWLTRQQREGGAFQTLMRDEPGVSGLCLLAFLSRGHLPREGPYGQELLRAAEFVLGS